MRLIKQIVSVLIFVLASPLSAKVPVDVYYYHAKPPYFIEESKATDIGQGIYPDVVKYLNEQSEQYGFRLTYMPRKRVEYLLDENRLNAPLIGVNPNWFKDPDKTKYFWSLAIFHDQDEFISLKTNPFNFTKPSDLHGKTMIGIAGFYYVGLMQLISENKLKRIDTIGERQVFELLAKERADFGIVSGTTYQYYLRHADIDDIYHVSEVSQDSYERYIMLPKTIPEVAAHIQSLLEQPQGQAFLLALKSKY